MAFCRISYYVGGISCFAFLSGYPSPVYETLIDVGSVHFERTLLEETLRYQIMTVGQDTGKRRAFVESVLALRDKHRNACRRT